MPFALATFTLDIDPTTASVGDTITFSGMCDEADEVLFQLTRGPNTVWIDEVERDVSSSYSTTYTPLVDGTYTLYASCSSTQSATFCIGASCTPSVEICDNGIDDDSDGATDCDDSDCSSDAACTTVTPTSTPSRGGAGWCYSEWTCGSWSYCSKELIQERECTDAKRCSYPTQQPNLTRNCASCDQSWICSEWSACTNGKNTRSCVDEHFCSSTSLKPSLTKSCNQAYPPGPRPSGVSQSPPGSSFQSGSQAGTIPSYGAPSSSFIDTLQSVWKNYALLVVGIPLALLLILLITGVVLHYIHKHKPAVNQDQLHTYIREEKKAGMPIEKIRENLESSGWNDTEISNALVEKPTFATQTPSIYS
jgi:hypothetical protein